VADQKDVLFGVPGGEVRTENPDGVMWSEGGDPQHNLWDEHGRPMIPSGDWKVRPSDLKPRGRP